MGKTEDYFDLCIKNISPRLSALLYNISPKMKNEIQEIRIRNGLPLSVTVKGTPLFVMFDGQTSYDPVGAYMCSVSDIEETYSLLTNHSVYAHSEEIKEGFIRLPYGCRAGVSGSFSDSGVVFDISGINIRIAREFIGCADRIYADYNGGGLLLLGPPGSGKTTFLRDFIRQLSNIGKRVSVIDTRGEISASYQGKACYDLGPNTDVYITGSKAFGIIAALRTMFPRVIAFDEIGTEDELLGVMDGFNAGVDILTTAHIGRKEDITSRKVVFNLIDSGAVKNVFLLSENIGEPPLKIDIKDVLK